MSDDSYAVQPNRALPSQDYGTGIPTRGKLLSLGQTPDAAPPLPCLQRDCKPHRGRLLWSLGVASLGLGGLAAAFFPLAAVAVPLGLVTWIMARFDLAKIQDGVMDPYGERLTYEAANDSMASLVLSCSGLVIWGAIYFCMLLGR
jgi:hypothetical protein